MRQDDVLIYEYLDDLRASRADFVFLVQELRALGESITARTMLVRQQMDVVAGYRNTIIGLLVALYVPISFSAVSYCLSQFSSFAYSISVNLRHECLHQRRLYLLDQYKQDRPFDLHDIQRYYFARRTKRGFGCKRNVHHHIHGRSYKPCVDVLGFLRDRCTTCIWHDCSATCRRTDFPKFSAVCTYSSRMVEDHGAFHVSLVSHLISSQPRGILI